MHLDARRHPDPSGQCLLRLLSTVEAHVRDESASVATYERIGRETRDPVVAAVMELVVEDEQNHHALLQRIAASLSERLNWQRTHTRCQSTSSRHTRCQSTSSLHLSSSAFACAQHATPLLRN